MDYLPAIKVTQGEPFGSSFTLQGQDWTGYTGTVTYKTMPQGELILETACSGDALGEVPFAVTALQSAEFPALARLRFLKVGVYQIRMSNGVDARTFQGDLLVAGAI